MATLLTGEIVKEYLIKFPNTPSLSLARKIYAENGEAFSGVECVRNAVRYYRGASGERHRERLADKRFADYNPYKLPEPDPEDYDPFYILGTNKILVFSDVHIPYHDVEALTVMINYAKDRDITAVLINGDMWDFHQLSYFLKDPRKRRTRGELDIGRAFLRTLREVFPTQKIYLKLGNHEERWEKYLMSKAPELYDTELFELSDLLRTYDLGIEVISEKRIIKAGKLSILHGHEIGMKGINVNPARTTFLKTHASTLVGHLHRTSEHTEPDLDGDVITCWSAGCMCDLHPQYAPINKWNHGFATVRVDEGGYYNVKNRRIINGEVR